MKTKLTLLTLLFATSANAQFTPNGIFTGSRQYGTGSLDEQYRFYMSLPSTDAKERDVATFKYNIYKEAQRNLQQRNKPTPRPQPFYNYDSSDHNNEIEDYGLSD